MLSISKQEMGIVVCKLQNMDLRSINDYKYR